MVFIVKNGNLVPRKVRPEEASFSGGSHNFQISNEVVEEEKKEDALSEGVLFRDNDSRISNSLHMGPLSGNYDQLSFQGGFLSDECAPISLKNLSVTNSIDNDNPHANRDAEIEEVKAVVNNQDEPVVQQNVEQ